MKMYALVKLTGLLKYRHGRLHNIHKGSIVELMLALQLRDKGSASLYLRPVLNVLSFPLYYKAFHCVHFSHHAFVDMVM